MLAIRDPRRCDLIFYFFFNDTATTEIYTLSLHDALPISGEGRNQAAESVQAVMLRLLTAIPPGKVRFTIIDPVGLGDRKSTRLNSSHANISYAVFCLKKKKYKAHHVRDTCHLTSDIAVLA